MKICKIIKLTSVTKRIKLKHYSKQDSAVFPIGNRCSLHETGGQCGTILHCHKSILTEQLIHKKIP